MFYVKDDTNLLELVKTLRVTTEQMAKFDLVKDAENIEFVT